MSHLSTHVLDTASGAPAAGLAVELHGPDGEVLGRGTTDADGRVSELGPDRLEPGAHRLVFATGAWFADRGVDAFFPSVTVDLRVPDPPAGHYHVPVLLSPFAFTAYRGS